MKRLVIAACALILSIPLALAQEQAVEEFYKGKSIRVIVGGGPGQEYDLWARLLSRHIGRLTPGHPSFVVENMLGGGHVIATNYLYNIAAKDGSVIGTVSRHMTETALLGNPAVRFQPEKFTWIGSTDNNYRGLFVRGGKDINKAEEMFDKELILGGTGAGQGLSSAAWLFKNLFGFKIKLVEGYKDTNAVWIAVERGEVDGVVQTVANHRLEAVKAGTVKLMFTIEKRIPELNAPSLFEFVKTEEQRQILEFFTMPQDLGRPFMGPPDIPADRVQALRKSFEATLKDSEFLAEAAKSSFEVDFKSGEEIAKRVQDAVNLPRSIIDKVQKMVNPT